MRVGVACVDREAWLGFYRERGLATLPLRPREKRPLRAGWQTPSASAWDGAPPEANLGVLCGKASGGLVVLDFDTRDGVHEAMGMRPEEVAYHTLVVQTYRGWHVYAREFTLATCSPRKGLDVRAEGSMVVAPPSIHPSGARYEFLRPDAPAAPLASLPISIETHPAPKAADVELDWEELEAWIGIQAPKLQAAWRALQGAAPPGFDRSRADFAVARCLWEGGYSVQEVTAVLLALPGSKAAERGRAYASLTAVRAATGTTRPRSPERRSLA